MLGALIDGRYRVKALIGHGGMSAIYEAEQLGVGRNVALKVLHPSLADDPEAGARVRHEAEVVGAIGHPNICEIYDLGRTAAGSPYLVMERLVGETLATRIARRGPLPFLELVPILKQVLDALTAAHARGILHRDLKPENVFLEEHRASGPGATKLLDFGISKSIGRDFGNIQRLTHTGMVMGTPYYMAPEQARGDSVLDERVDLWAVGVIAYEALTARRPFDAGNYNALLVKILTSRPPPLPVLRPDLPVEVVALVDKALAKERKERFSSAAELREEIARVGRIAAAEDPHAPTLVMRRKRPSSVAPAVASGGWHGAAIDDPSTFLDDDLDDDLDDGPDHSHYLAGSASDTAEHAPAEHLIEVEPTIDDDPSAGDGTVSDTELMRRAEVFREAMRGAPADQPLSPPQPLRSAVARAGGAPRVTIRGRSIHELLGGIDASDDRRPTIPTFRARAASETETWVMSPARPGASAPVAEPEEGDDDERTRVHVAPGGEPGGEP